jgi:hypothetical protein
VDWVNFLTHNFVDIVVTQLRLFRAAQKEVAEASTSASSPADEGKKQRLKDLGMEGTTAAALAGPEALADAFFAKDPKFAAICRSRVVEAQYCRDIAEVLCYLTLPEHAFEERATRFLLREVVALIGLQKSVDMVANPDYVNATIATSVSDACMTVAAVQDMIETSHSLAELDIVSESIYADIKLRQELVEKAGASKSGTSTSTGGGSAGSDAGAAGGGAAATEDFCDELDDSGGFVHMNASSLGAPSSPPAHINGAAAAATHNANATSKVHIDKKHRTLIAELTKIRNQVYGARFRTEINARGMPLDPTHVHLKRTCV